MTSIVQPELVWRSTWLEVSLRARPVLTMPAGEANTFPSRANGGKESAVPNDHTGLYGKVTASAPTCHLTAYEACTRRGERWMRLPASKDVAVLFLDQDNKLAKMRMKVFDTACCEESTIPAEGNPQKLLFRSGRQWKAHYSSKNGLNPLQLAHSCAHQKWVPMDGKQSHPRPERW